MSKTIPFIQANKQYSDESIFEGLILNQRESIAHLYREIYPKAKAQLRRMGASDEDIKDMFQEGMVALWKNAQKGTFQLQANVKLSTYLVQICKVKWLEKRRKAQNRNEINTDQIQEKSEPESFLDHWFKEEELAKLRLHFKNLGTRCQDLLKRFYFQRESMKQIALAFTITEASAKNEKYRCIQRLKSIYKNQ